ncbi:MAG TPA: sulfurtransferase [Ferruginibacter sp.]|nr:sulfurtransferase [Ferruginibacter sp.]
MEQEISPIIDPANLISLSPSPGVVIIDARTGANARANYDMQHLQGALFVDLDTNLANIKPGAADGGRHPLPHPAEFSALLGSLGITTESHVLVYDDKNGSNAAARFWWMMRSVGHKKVQVINGGLQAAIAAGFPLSAGTEDVLPLIDYGNVAWELPLTDINEVEHASQDKNFTIIDVRDKERFNGEKEPIDLVAGHIPNAMNIPLTQNLDKNGFFLPPGKLKALYTDALKDKDADKIIVHCGSGVTACHTILAMAYAGMTMPKLYVGSWSEWSRNGKKIATGL